MTKNYANEHPKYKKKTTDSNVKVASYRPGKQLEVDHFILDPDFRSLGIGTILLHYIETWAKNQECITLELNAYVGNSRGHKFYFQNGYKILGFHFQKNL